MKRRGPPKAARKPTARPERDEPKLLRVAGLPAVEALFATAPGRVERLFFLESLKNRVGPLCMTIAKSHKTYRVVREDELRRIAGTSMHGGIVALAAPPAMARFDPAAAEAWAKAGEPLLILDGVGNPHNLGAIARTAAFFGIRRMVLSDHADQASPSDAAYRVARGGLEAIAVHRVERLPEMLRRIKTSYRVVGTALTRGEPLDSLARDDRPIALVLGNEEEGLSSATLAATPEIVRLAGTGGVQSLNVAATAAILIHALLRRA